MALLDIGADSGECGRFLGEVAGRLGRGGTRIATLALIGLFLTPFVYPQSPGEYEVKAAFLYNFGKFVEWPPQSFKRENDPILICILGPSPFGNTLAQDVQGKQIGSRPIRIHELAKDEPLSNCKILFVNASERRRFQSLMPGMRNAGVLTVGEYDSFIAEGGIIDFKLEDGRIRLQINVAQADFEGLHISSKLLSLAHLVRQRS